MSRRRKRRKRRVSGYVYVFHKKRRLARDHYKLGKTVSSVEARLSHARTGSSHPVEEYERYRVRNVHSAEAKLHAHFEHKRVQQGTRNEWFLLDTFDLLKIRFLLVGE